MIEINLTAYQHEPISGHTSKGDQPKWHVGDSWYKADHMGYEALVEVLVSWMLERSNVANFLAYAPVVIREGDKSYTGCQSKNFREKGEMLLPLEKLHRAYCGVGLAQKMASLPTAEERIEYAVSFVEEKTGLADFGRYMSVLLELDAFILNEDRHTNNIAVIRDEKTKHFRLCPLFDHGLSLLSDLNDYPLTRDVYACINAVTAKPFSTDFSEQLDAANHLYGSHLWFHFTKSQFCQKLQQLSDYYSADILGRVETVVLEQMRRYSYLFSA